LYVIAVVFLTRFTYKIMKKHGFEEMVAVYYNRKIIHIVAGGVVALLIPFLLNSWIYPFAMSLILTLFMVLWRLTGDRLDFMQMKENWNETKFTLMWGLSIALLWILFNDPFLAVIPSLFMAFGDAVTGFVRNALYKERTKSLVGNVFMFIVCIFIGYYFASVARKPIPLWGILAAAVASIVERFEIGPVDDNILITVSTMIILIAGNLIG
jgi:phytol kinase